MEPLVAFPDVINGKEKKPSTDTFQQEYTEFVEIATHDLDAPLRKLSMLFDLLMNKFSDVLADHNIHPYLQRIEVSIRDMRSIIDDLSILSRINSEKLRSSECDLESIIQNIIDELQPIIRKKKAIITTASLPVVEGNPAQVKQLFRNLIDNAIKFAKKDTAPFIRISSLQLNREEKISLQLSENTPYFKIEISDNGIGFDQRNAEKIFRPFYRLHGKSKYPGTGIGLTISKKIVQRHGGLIYANSRENSGSCFVIILPQTTNY